MVDQSQSPGAETKKYLVEVIMEILLLLIMMVDSVSVDDCGVMVSKSYVLLPEIRKEETRQRES